MDASSYCSSVASVSHEMCSYLPLISIPTNSSRRSTSSADQECPISGESCALDSAFHSEAALGLGGLTPLQPSQPRYCKIKLVSNKLTCPCRRCVIAIISGPDKLSVPDPPFEIACSCLSATLGSSRIRMRPVSFRAPVA